MREAKVFISHSHADTESALKLKQDLQASGIEAWSYEYDLRFGAELNTTIRQHITDADHFLLILSPEACSSQWVAREVGLALALRELRGSRHPSLIGVANARTASCYQVQPLDYDTGTSLGAPVDFSGSRRLNLDGKGADRMEWLLKWLRPQLRIITNPDDADAELFQDSLSCYRRLFPDTAERDGVAEIRGWLNEARCASIVGGPWREVYAVLHLGELAVGLLYLSVHKQKHLSFGNYLGVRSGWRQRSRTEKLLSDTWERAKGVDPCLRGILFEVEPIDMAVLTTAACSYRHDEPLDSNVISQLRKLRRLLLYQAHGARAFVDRQGVPLKYLQPAMQEPLGPPNEVPMILMAWPGIGVKLDEAMEFLLNDLYGDAYGGEGDMQIPGYRDYVNRLQAEVIGRAGDHWHLDRVRVPRAVTRLLGEAIGSHYRTELSL